MSTDASVRASNAYDYPLLIKHLFNTTTMHGQGQEIVHRDLVRYPDRLTFDAGRATGPLRKAPE